MCFSADCWAHYDRYVEELGVAIHIRDFAEMYGYKPLRKRRRPRAMDEQFRGAQTSEEAEIWEMIEAGRRLDIREWQEELFKQRRRVADAERLLVSGETLTKTRVKKAEDDIRIGGNKVKQLKRWLDDAERPEAKPDDSRMFPGDWVPVVIWEDGRRVLKPMRFQCRLQGWTEAVERRYPGTYNARRDSLPTSWNKHWGYKHAVIVISSFYEHVWRHQAEGRDLRPGEAEQDVVIRFKPNSTGEMVLACLYSDWGGPGEAMQSFAFITDEPPPEVAAAGHDRCVIPIKRETIDAWLQPDPANLAAMEAILDDRERPYYEHEIEKAA